MSDRLRTATLAVTVLGLGVAVYLTYAHYAGIDPACGISHGCSKVQASDWATFAGIPVAVLGLIGYVSILAVLLLVPGDTGLLAAVGLAWVGFGFSMYLTYVEIAEIDAICQWCVASAVCMTLLAALTTTRFLRAPSQETTA
ncbi:vitamin K epoxide reductase [Conexibacter sp. W3-3-2]|uniref:vitamin K epoxide reductase family protein n=1 Tax=Conexibacter sp. W3-3-2 TaxID=2675227 RepID=UPI0012BA18C6|nr:vitamin K epoxide reductase family protein [Conexibacter sp. W3-3-2]MTD45127.1 vitamin K epoxide reductase [Conexibacter sp. W3-3-2]